MSERPFRLRLCYKKMGRLRYLSHLEIARALERSIRRAGLPYTTSQGFNPRMRIAFGPALPVGTAGMREYADVLLARHVPSAEAMERLQRCTPSDLGPCGARYVKVSSPSLGAALTVARYQVRLETEGCEAGRIAEGLSSVISRGELVVEHKGKQKVFDLTRALPEEPRVREEGFVSADVTTRIGPDGSLRPEALLSAAIEMAGVHASVAAVTRTDLLVETERSWLRPM